MAGVNGMHRENLVAKVLICFYDARHTDIEHSILATYEVDMNNRGGITYYFPDLLLPISDFHKKIRIGIKTRG